MVVVVSGASAAGAAAAPVIVVNLSASTLYPSGSPLPLASNLNFTPGKTVPNLVVVKLGAGGRVAMYNSAGSTHVIFDVAGYYQPYADSFYGHFHPLVPARIADTRSSFGGVRLGPGQSFDLQVTSRGGAPASGVSAAVLNVAATNTTATSYLTVYPTGEGRPVASNLNFAPGDTVSNRTMTKVGAGGRVTIYNDSGATDVVVDIGGTYSNLAGGGGVYTPVDPSRILDTRYTGIVPANGTLEVHVAGRAGVPAGARAVILNATVTGPAGVGYLTIFPPAPAGPGPRIWTTHPAGRGPTWSSSRSASTAG